MDERIPASGVVWYEAPESAIQSVLTGGVSPMVLKDCASAAWSHSVGQVEGGRDCAGGAQVDVTGGAAPATMAAGRC